jgi:glycerate kinase
MRILLAPDKFKSSLTAPQVCAAMGAGLRARYPDAEIDACPVADGGEGTVAALITATAGRMETTRVTGPRCDMQVDASFGVLGNQTTVVIEMAAASGLALLDPRDLDPATTTTFGTGQLLLAAARLGAREIILGIGGSATLDAGVGCCQACGMPIILEDGPADPREPLLGADLRRIVLIKRGRGGALDRVRITVACDVTNPLFGADGAARIFGPQKGATPGQVEEFDALHHRLAERCGKLSEAAAPGAGAAGGLGWAMLSFFDATLRPGFEIVADAVRLRDRLRGADLCLTGEGRLDASSLSGKAAVGVARICKELKIPCIAIVGSAGPGADLALREGLTAIIPIQTPNLPLDDAIAHAPSLIESVAATLDLSV